MTKIILVRHGLSVTNNSGRFTGQKDVALHDVGYEQAKIVSQYIKENYKVDRIYSSDLQRAVNTIKPLADMLGLNIETSKNLRELNVGKWQDIKIEDVKRLYPDIFENYIKKPREVRCGDGESYGELSDRSLAEIKKIASENDGKTVVVATHGGVIRVLRCAWSGLEIERASEVPHVGNASITVVDFDNNTLSAEIALAGFDGYLGEDMLSSVPKYESKE